jgi:hypothetical protein
MPPILPAPAVRSGDTDFGALQASSLKSHTQHGGHQAGDGPRQTNPTSLTDAEGGVAMHSEETECFATRGQHFIRSGVCR